MTTAPAPSPSNARPEATTVAEQRSRHHWWRWVAGVVVVVLVAFLAAAWYFSGRIYSGALAVEPFTWPPSYDDVKVTSLDAGVITLDKGPDAGVSFDAPSAYGLAWDGGTGYVGPATVVDADTTTREFTLATGSAPTVGALAAFERAYWLGHYPSALGIPWSEVPSVDPLGLLPAWWFPAEDGDTTTTAIFVHGQNASRLDGLRAVETLHQVGLPVLDITYRNDPGTVPDPSGRLGYGVTEWPDLEAAVAWAADHGADDVVLVAQSMGAGVVASFLENSSQASLVSKVVLDAPMLSLEQTVEYGARDAMPGGWAVPTPLLWAAERVTSLRWGVDWSAIDYLDDTSWVTVPTLVLHGAADPRIPVEESRQLSAAEPDLVTYEEFPNALHVESWNTDRPRWTAAVTAFLSGTS